MSEADTAPLTAEQLPPADPRIPLIIRFDLGEVGNNIVELSDELHDDGSNRKYVIRRMKAEIAFLHELLDELESAP